MSALPKGWVEAKLEEVAKWSSGGTPSRSKSEYYSDEIPWIKTGDLNDSIVEDASEYISELGLKNSSAKLFPKGSIGIAMYGATIGKTGVFGLAAATNQACAVAVPNDAIVPSFLHSYLKFQKPVFIEKGKGGAQPNISQGVIKEHPIPLPPLAEQERIVEKLDALFASLDVIKDKLDRIPELLKNFRQQVLTQAVTGKLTEEWREGKGLHIPKKSKLNDLGKWSGGGTPSKSKKEYWSNGSVLWVTPKDMKSLFIQDSLDKITPESIEDSSAKWISSNSILIVTRSGILRRTLPVAMNTVDCTVNQDLKVLTVKKGIESKYILYSLIGLEATIRSTCMKAGTTVESIEFSFLKEYEVYLPSLEEQQEIVRRVEELFAIADRVAAQYTSLKEKIDQLPQAILAKAFRGELVEQDENDEPANVLLERIKAEREAQDALKKKKPKKPKAKAYQMKEDELLKAAEKGGEYGEKSVP